MVCAQNHNCMHVMQCFFQSVKLFKMNPKFIGRILLNACNILASSWFYH